MAGTRCSGSGGSKVREKMLLPISGIIRQQRLPEPLNTCRLFFCRIQIQPPSFLRINHLPLLQSGSTGCALDIIYRKDKQTISAERYPNMGLLLRVLSGVCSVFVRKKHLFSEQIPKEYRIKPGRPALLVYRSALIACLSFR